MSEINSVSIEDAFAITVTFLKEEQEKTKNLQAIIDDSEKIVNELKSISLGYKEIIDDLAEGISFYGDTKNWTVSTNPVLFNIMETVDESHMWGKQISGKRARALQGKYPEVFKK